MKRYRKAMSWLLVAGLVTLQCGRGTGPKDESPAVAEWVIVSGNHQVGQAGEPLSQPVVMRLVDDTQTPLSDQDVSIEVVEGDGSVENSALTTNGQGEIQISWRLGDNYNALAVSLETTGFPCPVCYIFSQTADPEGFAWTQSIYSLQEVHGVYVMDFIGDFSEFWASRNVSMLPDARMSEHHCSLFATRGNPAAALYGRNTDSPESRILLSRVNPPSGYASISMTRIFEIGYDAHEDLTVLDYSQRRGLAMAPFFMIDGMNERGVTVAVADYYNRAYQTDPAKSTLVSMYMMRKILNEAGSLEEALEIIRQHNIWDGPVGEFHSQYLVADAQGSAWVYCRNGTIQIAPADTLWQTAGHRSSESRQALANVNGQVTWQEAMTILSGITQSGAYPTIYSVVYDMSDPKAYIALDKNYNEFLLFDFDQWQLVEY